jgi:hypothetical protein
VDKGTSSSGRELIVYATDKYHQGSKEGIMMVTGILTTLQQAQQANNA